MPLSDSRVSAIDGVEVLAIALCKTGPEQIHTGLLYTIDSNTPIFCHLAWQKKLDFDEGPMPFSPIFWREVELDRVNRIVLAAFLEELKIYKNDIPYGFDCMPPVFLGDGTYVVQPDGKGLTCATFVVEVYRANQLPLISEETWPTRLQNDAAWQREIVGHLEGHPRASQEHIDGMKADIGRAARFKPEEVAAAVVQPLPPHQFADCIELAGEIRALCLG